MSGQVAFSGFLTASFCPKDRSNFRVLFYSGLFIFLFLVRLRPLLIDDFCASLFDLSFIFPNRLSDMVDLVLLLSLENAVEVFDQLDFSMPDCPHISKLQIILTIPVVGPPLPHEPGSRESE